MPRKPASAKPRSLETKRLVEHYAPSMTVGVLKVGSQRASKIKAEKKIKEASKIVPLPRGRVVTTKPKKTTTTKTKFVKKSNLN